MKKCKICGKEHNNYLDAMECCKDELNQEGGKTNE